MTYRGRLAPSPTGDVHVGHARTYLVAWLRARQAGGQLVMRIEDLDPPRVVDGAAERLQADLRWLGLDWDEGPDVGGPAGPYLQSARGDRYAEALTRLPTYPCTCSRKEIRQLASAPHGVEGLGMRYPGTCRDGPRHPERAAATRFVMPEPPPPCVDLLMGPQDTQDLGGDFVLRRADGLWAYQLAVVVDDAAMGITEVVRGADLLPSTPRQLALFAALGAPAPAFLHVPLVHGPDGERLAKRHRSTSLADYRAAGWSAPALVGALAASLGLIDAPRPATPHELLEHPLLERLHREPAVAPAIRRSSSPPGQ